MDNNKLGWIILAIIIAEALFIIEYMFATSPYLPYVS